MLEASDSNSVLSKTKNYKWYKAFKEVERPWKIYLFNIENVLVHRVTSIKSVATDLDSFTLIVVIILAQLTPSSYRKT